MPIGKLLTLPEVSSSINFPRQIDSSYGCGDDDDRNEGSIDFTKQSEGYGDRRVIVKQNLTSNLQKEKKKKIQIDNYTDRFYPDGDHVHDLNNDLNPAYVKSIDNFRPNFENEVSKWIHIHDKDVKVLPTASKSLYESSTQLPHLKDLEDLHPVFLPKGVLFKSYSDSETEDDPELRCDSWTDPIASLSLTSTFSQTEEGFLGIDEDFKMKLTKELDTLECLEEKKSVLLKQMEENINVIEKCKASIHTLSTQQLTMKTEVRDICFLISEFSKRESEARLEETTGIMLTLTPEMNQVIVGVVVGWAGAYATKHFAKTMLAAIGGGAVVACLANKGGYLNINWKRIEEDLSLIFSPIPKQDRSLKKHTGAKTDTTKQTNTTLSKTHHYALGGFLGAFFVGLVY